MLFYTLPLHTLNLQYSVFICDVSVKKWELRVFMEYTELRSELKDLIFWRSWIVRVTRVEYIYDHNNNNNNYN
jgi:hypothetical protein